MHHLCCASHVCVCVDCVHPGTSAVIPRPRLIKSPNPAKSKGHVQGPHHLHCMRSDHHECSKFVPSLAGTRPGRELSKPRWPLASRQEGEGEGWRGRDIPAQLQSSKGCSIPLVLTAPLPPPCRPLVRLTRSSQTVRSPLPPCWVNDPCPPPLPLWGMIPGGLSLTC